MPLPRTITAALATLNAMIAAGADYADAEWKASEAHRVSASRLRAAYDAQPCVCDRCATKPASAATPEPKPATPQVEALPGMTPLGLPGEG